MNGMVGRPERGEPVREVATKEMEREERRGMRKVEVQPAPRMRMSTATEGGEELLVGRVVMGGEGHARLSLFLAHILMFQGSRIPGRYCYILNCVLIS